MADVSETFRSKIYTVFGLTGGNELIPMLNSIDVLSSTEVEFINDVTAGTAAAGKALVLNASKGITTITSATITTLTTGAKPLTTFGVGAKNGATVAATENGNGIIHQTRLTCTATPLTFGDEAGQGQFGGVKVYDFPGGAILFMGAVVDGAITLSLPAIDTWGGDVGLGLEVPTDHQDAANKAGRLMATNATQTAASKVGAIAGFSACTDLTESQATWLNGTSTAIDLLLNVLVDDNVAHDNTITGTFTGTIQFLWINLGTTPISGA